MREIYLNSPDQVRSYMREALEITDELDPSPDLRAIVFAKGVDMIAAKNVTVEQGDISPLAIPRMDIPRGR